MIYIFTRYGRIGASSRIRTLQYFDDLKIDYLKRFTFNSLINNEQLLFKYKYKKYQFISILVSYLKRLILLLKIKSKDLIYIEKELYPYLPFFLEYFFLYKKNYILNYDDAVFDYYESHKNIFIRYILSKKHKSLIKNSSLTICGNLFLANYAKNAGCKNIKILPSVINMKRYQYKKVVTNNKEPIICWIGSSATIVYLKEIEKPLQEIAKKNKFVLKIIGVNDYKINGVNIMTKKWREDTEIDELINSDIGIMPLFNNRFSQGKCSYKLIQYMGVGLPVVASKIGENINTIKHGVNGYLAGNQNDWIKYLNFLINDPNLREKFGSKGKEIVKDKYSLQNTKETYFSFFDNQNLK